METKQSTPPSPVLCPEPPPGVFARAVVYDDARGTRWLDWYAGIPGPQGAQTATSGRICMPPNYGIQGGEGIGVARSVTVGDVITVAEQVAQALEPRGTEAPFCWAAPSPAWAAFKAGVDAALRKQFGLQ